MSCPVRRTGSCTSNLGLLCRQGLGPSGGIRCCTRQSKSPSTCPKGSRSDTRALSTSENLGCEIRRRGTFCYRTHSNCRAGRSNMSCHSLRLRICVKRGRRRWKGRRRSRFAKGRRVSLSQCLIPRLRKVSEQEEVRHPVVDNSRSLPGCSSCFRSCG